MKKKVSESVTLNPGRKGILIFELPKDNEMFRLSAKAEDWHFALKDIETMEEYNISFEDLS